MFDFHHKIRRMRRERKAMNWKRWIGITALAASTLATAQDPQFSKNPTDFHSAATIHEDAAKLLEQAKASPDGLAQLRLDTYPGHNITLTVRVKSGGGEIHANWSDVFIVIAGEATVVTGGKVESPVSKPDGEIRGTKVVGGSGQVLHAGDVFHVSPGVPHQTTVAPGKTFTYMVVKAARQ
jgi:mannose-6-phosphate isomerase-like protein (cupin superfamily)